MSLFVISGIAVGLSMDAFAVAVACSLTLREIQLRQVFRLAFHFGLFQAMMPMIGWIIGQGAAHYIINYDHWVAFGLLAFVGGKAIYEAVYGEDEAANRADPTRGMSLIIFSLATSVDALAVGLSLAMIGVDIIYPAALIGIICAAITTLGMLIGTKVGAHFGQRMEIAGGLVLIAIGAKILFSHLF
ncbi:manganese efflux pump MntP family protein [bacterium]|nr:manganese efflux pump MntP family protein [bacterium]